MSTEKDKQVWRALDIATIAAAKAWDKARKDCNAAEALPNSETYAIACAMCELKRAQFFLIKDHADKAYRIAYPD